MGREERRNAMAHNPIPFAARPDVPLLGQPCTINAWIPVMNLTCNCEKIPLLIAGLGHQVNCPKCAKGYKLNGIAHDIRTGQPPHFEIEVILPRSPANGNGPDPA